MKKQTLAILLVSPILVSLFTFATVRILVNQMSVDISDILWNYKENEGFKADENNAILLEATPVYDETKTLSDGNDLVWSVSDTGSSDEETDAVCEVKQLDDGQYYLYALGEGQATIVCQNEKKSISKSFNAVVYESGAIIINVNEANSGDAINSTRYFGQYDLSYDANDLTTDSYTKENATISFDITMYLDDGVSDNYSLTSSSDNITYQDETVTITGYGDAYLTFTADTFEDITTTYRFSIVEDGVNIRSYDDLLRATNYSSSGEVAVMQISLGSLTDTYQYVNGEVTNTYLSDNTRLFGHYDFTTKTFSFENEYYVFESDYNTEFIDQYNEIYSEDESKQLSKNLKAGLHVQKSIYGNGFSINQSNLAYPNNGSINTTTGKLTPDSEKDYFQGPLPFVFLGDPLENPFISAYGQDNAGIYIDSDNVTLDDLRIKNVDDTDNRYNLSFTGTVIDIENAKNVTIKNCVISNGKNIVRAFSSDNLLIDNCILRNSGEFLLHAGSNKSNKADKTQRVQASIEYGDTTYEVDKSFSEFYDVTYSEDDEAITADNILTTMLMASITETDDATKELLYKAINIVQDGLDNTSGMINEDGSINYDANITINDTSFSNSGVYSIALDTSFNGGYLYNGYPSMVSTLMDQMGTTNMAIPPDEIGSTSYPIHLTLEGDTKFYDWKDIDSIDATTLIQENLSALVKQMFPSLDADLSIDDYFPIKAILKEEASEAGLLYEEDGVSYLNTSLIWYGGGLNLSTVENNITSTDNTFSDEYALDMAHAYIYGEHVGEGLADSSNSTATMLVKALANAVLCVTGSHDFKTITNGVVDGTPTLFNKTPSVSDLKGRG